MNNDVTRYSIVVGVFVAQVIVIVGYTFFNFPFAAIVGVTWGSIIALVVVFILYIIERSKW